MADEEKEEQPPEDLAWMDAPDTGSGAALSIESEDGTTPPPPPPSPWAVKLDQWGKRRGRDLAKEEFGKAVGATPEDCADMHGMAFEYEPELVENCTDPDKLQFLKMLQESPEYQALHLDTQLDSTASELATAHFTGQYYELKKKRDQDRQKQPKKGQKQDPAQEELRQEMEALAAAGRAVKGAEQDVQELRDTEQAMGIGQGPGGGGKMSPKEVKQLFQAIRKDPGLKAIMELAGKYRQVARSRQRQKVIHGYDDMVGVVLDNDIGRIVPHELAMLTHPIMKLDALRRFTERQMICREHKGVQKVGKGPIMVFIDESGSMSGPLIHNAKAMGLSMAWIAKQQNRWCALVGWSSKSQHRKLVLPPNKWPTAEIMQWLGGFLNGGTHLPVEAMPKIYQDAGAQKGKTDIIIITDGETEQITPAAMADFAKWKQEVQAKIIGISIQARSTTLKSISDEFHLIQNLSVNNDAVASALSI